MPDEHSDFTLDMEYTPRVFTDRMARKVCSLTSADDVLDRLCQIYDEEGKEFQLHDLSIEECCTLIQQCFQRQNYELALSVYKAVLYGGDDLEIWPLINLKCVYVLVLGLAQGLRIGEAVSVVEGLRQKGLRSAEVYFGDIVTCPLPPNAPLAVVDPLEGPREVACSETRYLFSLFTGVCIKSESQALETSSNILFDLARKIGVDKRKRVEAVHELQVQAHDGTSRTFRFGTGSADVPCVEGDKVTVVCAGGKQQGKLIGNGPPNCSPGQVMQVSNHTTANVCMTQRAPASDATSGIPGWVLPATILFAASDTASSLIDPNLPLLIGLGTVASLGSAAVATTFVWPELKRLPENRLAAEQQRQRLLKQHEGIAQKLRTVMSEIEDDVRNYARLFQLRIKMQSVGQEDAYGSRLEQVSEAMGKLEKRLLSQLQLVEGYSQVINMIEIEVETEGFVIQELESYFMDQKLGIEEQINRLIELEELSEEWKYQVQAQDELTRLLKIYK